MTKNTPSLKGVAKIGIGLQQFIYFLRVTEATKVIEKQRARVCVCVRALVNNEKASALMNDEKDSALINDEKASALMNDEKVQR